MDWLVNQIINLCLLIDTMIYSINKLLFNLFMYVASATFPKEVYEKFLSNVYIVIGIFMLFRVAFSLIQMLANPDMMADKEKGAGKLATRVVIAFALIVIVPTVFDMAYGLQKAIIDDNIIGQLILGKNNSPDSNLISNQGERIAIQVFKGMITINDNVDKNDAKVKACEDARISPNSYTTISSLRNVNGNIDCFTDTVGGERIYDYKILVSSLATGMVAWLLVGFCIDMSVRLFKLMFYQLIAPVCIVTYVNGGKDNAFNKWLKMTISAFVSVFIKLIVIYFVIYLASQIADQETLKQLKLDSVPLGSVALILGLLVFAKNAPKLIGDLFGIKMDEESGFKGIAKTALLGGAALAASGGAAGVSNLFKGIGDTAKNVGKAGGLNSKAGWKALGAGALGTIGSTIGGTTAGAFYGARNGFGKNASLGGSINKALMTSRTNRDARDDRATVYGGGVKSAFYNIGDRILGFAGIDTQAKKVANQHKNIGAGLNRARGNINQAQNELATTMNYNQLDALNRYTYNAFDDQWSKTNDDGTITTFDKGYGISDIMIADATVGSIGIDAQTYLEYSKQDAQLEKRIIENSKAQGKAETQQKKMEGSNGNK